MKNRLTYSYTRVACYLGSMTQAVNCCFVPLLFVSFRQEFGLSLEKVTLLITVNFLVQLISDGLGAYFADKIGHRICMVGGLLCGAAGTASLAVFPDIFPTPMLGLLASVVLTAISGGILEVLTSPIQDACPTANREASMSLLHSFYCWGSMAVAAISTGLFALLGIEHWRWVCMAWAALPLCTGLLFVFVPLPKIGGADGSMTVSQLLRTGVFWLLLLMMLLSGASELVISQWASTLAESGLKVSKAVADLAGPCLFAAMMGLGRVLHTGLAKKISMERYLLLSALLCILGYGLVVVPQSAAVNLLGCGICGFAVAVMWPGSLSLAAQRCPRGGTAMFGLLALGGDIGCTVGPTVTGFVSGRFGDDLKIGVAAAVVFPLLLLLAVLILIRSRTSQIQ